MSTGAGVSSVTFAQTDGYLSPGRVCTSGMETESAMLPSRLRLCIGTAVIAYGMLALELGAASLPFALPPLLMAWVVDYRGIRGYFTGPWT